MNEHILLQKDSILHSEYPIYDNTKVYTYCQEDSQLIYTNPKKTILDQWNATLAHGSCQDYNDSLFEYTLDSS